MSHAVRRHALGLLAAALLIGAVVFWFQPPQGTFQTMLEAACWRVGPVAALLWLAYWEVIRLPPWLLGTVPFLAAIIVFRPKWLIVAVPLVIALAILRPRTPTRRA